MTEPAQAPAPEEPAGRAGPRSVPGWKHQVRNLGANQSPGAIPEGFFANPARPEPPKADEKGEKAAEAPKDNGDKEFGDENDAYSRSETWGALLDALRTFNMRHTGVFVNTTGPVTFHGPVVGGDMGSPHPGAAMVTEKVSTTLIEEIGRYYVRPAGYQRAVETLARTRVLLLRTRRRWGGTTTGYRLLAQARSIYQLRMESPLGGLRSSDVPEKSGVLLDGLNPVQASGLRYADLRTLNEIMEERDSRIVVVLDWDCRVDAAVLRETVMLQAPPEARKVVLRHLRHVMPDRSDVDDLIAAPVVQTLLESVTEAGFDVGQLAEMARDLAETAAGRMGLDEVEQRFALRAQQSLRSWLDALSEPQLALVISLAALHGMSYDAVAAAAKKLEDAIVGEYADRLVRRAFEPRHARLAAARAVVTSVPRQSRYGVSEVEVASFADGSLPALVMRYAWHEYDTHRDLLTRWLRQVAEAPELTVRIRAATTLGYLSCFSFDQIRREVITPWAGSTNADERERAIAALALPARHPNTRDQVINLVNDWLDREGDGPLRVTGARALGLAVGEIMPGGPDERLDKLAERASPGFATTIGASVAELMLDADAERVRELVAMLRRWAGDAAGRRRIAGAFAFLEVASTLWTQHNEVWWPRMLALTDELTLAGGDLTEDIVELWCHALLAPRTDMFVHRVLRRWARAAEAHPPMRDAFVRLFVKVAEARPRLANLLRHHAKSWRGEIPDAPALAAKLLDILR